VEELDLEDDVDPGAVVILDEVMAEACGVSRRRLLSLLLSELEEGG